MAPPSQPRHRKARKSGQSAERVRVVLSVDRAALEDLEVMVRHRHRGASRSEVVAYAIMWLRAKEATWLLRIKAGEERAARLAEEEARRLAFDRAEWEQAREENSVAEAVAWVREQGPTEGVG